MEKVGKYPENNVYLFYCKYCDYKCNKKCVWVKHTLTAKHQKMEKVAKSMENIGKVPEKNINSYYCSCCNYICSIKRDLDRHLMTAKHQKMEKVANVSIINDSKYVCNLCNYTCSKEYNYQKHLLTAKHQKMEKVAEMSNHKNKYLHVENEDMSKQDKLQTDKDVIMLLIKENSELKNMIMKVLENGTNTNNTTNCNNNNTVSNNNNKTFNLHFFLNETCKNAMNITDFIESLQPQISDLESIGRLGFVEGISKIIIKGLKDLDETIRPIHCTDKKRETVYVKDENKWEKEDENKTRLRKAINVVAHENILLIPQWKAKHPDYLDSSSDCSDKYNNMVIEVLGGNDETSLSEDKIIRKIAKEVLIDKT